MYYHEYMAEWLVYAWSELNYVIIISNKYFDHIMMSISLDKMYSYYGVDSVVIS